MLDANTIIGFIGALVLLVAFLLNQIGHWETSDFEYDFINLIGAALLSVYGWQIGSYPLMLLFVVWTIFSLKDVLFDGFKNMKNKKKAKQEEKPMMKENAIMTEEEPKELDEEKKEMDKEQEPPQEN